MTAHQNSIAAVRRRRWLDPIAGFARSRNPWGTLHEGRIAGDLAAQLEYSLWQVHLNARVAPDFRADVLVNSCVAILVRTRPRPGPMTVRRQLEAACADESLAGIVLMSSLSEHRRVPSQIGSVPVAFVPLTFVPRCD